MTEQPRFVVFGSGGIFTFYVIKTLLDQSFIPLAYMQSGSQQIKQPGKFVDIEVQTPQPGNALLDMLNLHSIAVYYESEDDIQILTQQLSVEYLLVACWPRLIPKVIIDSVSKAALNLHPSLLPLYRGFDPIGEQLTKKDFDFGITLHLLNERFDEGDIVLQQNLVINHNSAATTINQITAIQGARLFIQAVETRSHPGWSLTEQIQ